MSEEIKKILDKLKDNIPEDYIRSCDTSDGIGYYEQDKDSWQYKLLDYITNLQEEIQKKEAMYDSLAVSYRLAQEENERLNNIIKEVREYNEQIIKDTKDFYRPTEDIIYSGDCLIDIATQNLEILDKPISKKSDNDF